MIKGWPPLYLTKVPEADIRRGDGALVVKRIETLCTVSMDSVASSAGSPLILRDWEKQLIYRMFARRPDGKRRHRLVFIGMPRKNGKALDVSTPVLTPDGWTTMGAIVPGDQVFALDGTPTRVEWVSDVHLHPTYRVNFADGSSLVASDEHQWLVNDRMRAESHRRQVITTSELARTLHCGTRRDRRYTVPVPEALDTSEAILPVAPYTFGAWLGDGNSASSRFTTADDDVLENIRSDGYRVERRKGERYTAWIYGLSPVLRSMGVLGNKHIPTSYLVASRRQRRELLAGLLDTDGTASSGARHERIEFCSTKERLARDVLTLIRTLGWKATLRKGVATLNGVEIGPKYRVCFTAYSDEVPFRLTRKNAGLDDRPSISPRSRTNAVVSVEPIPSVPVVCIAVEHESKVFLAGEGLTPTHNSALASAFAIDGLVYDGNGAEVYAAAAEKDQARIVFGETKRMINASPALSEICTPMKDVISIEGTNSLLRVLSAEAYSKEGLNISRNIIDELHAHPNDELFNVLYNGTGARQEPMTIVITTAGVMSDSTGRDSVCYSQYKHGVEVATGLVDDPTLFFAWWGAPEGADHRDPKVWEAANPGYGDILNPEDLADTVTKVPENDFRTKRLNLWVSSAEAWLPSGKWERLADKERVVEDGSRVAIGFDGSLTRDSTALIGATVGDHPHIFVIGIWERPDKAPPDWKIPVDDVIKTLTDACKKYVVPVVVVDPSFWQTEMEALADLGIPVAEHGQTASAMVPTTKRFYEGVVTEPPGMSQDGNEILARHMRHAVLHYTTTGPQLRKESRHSPRKIDGAVASVMAYEAAVTVRDTTPEVHSIREIVERLQKEQADLSGPQDPIEYGAVRFVPL